MIFCHGSSRMLGWLAFGKIGVRTDYGERSNLLIDFLCASAGGPLYYVGRDMKTSHRGMGIDGEDWSVFVTHLNVTLDKFVVPAEERSQVLGFIDNLRQDIVE